MTLPRLAAALAGLVLPVFLATTVEAAPRAAVHHGAHVMTVAERPASVQLVSRHHYRHRRHYSHRSYRRHG